MKRVEDRRKDMEEKNEELEMKRSDEKIRMKRR